MPTLIFHALLFIMACTCNFIHTTLLEALPILAEKPKYLGVYIPWRGP